MTIASKITQTTPTITQTTPTITQTTTTTTTTIQHLKHLLTKS